MPPVLRERFLSTLGDPLVPTFGEALDRALSQPEAAELRGYLGLLAESGAGLGRRAVGCLTAAREWPETLTAPKRCRAGRSR